MVSRSASGPCDRLHARTKGRTAIDWYPKRILLNRIWRIGEGRLVQSHKKRGWVIHNAILSVEYFYWFRSNGTYLFLIPKTFMVSLYRRLLESSLTCKLGRLFERHEINCILSPCQNEFCKFLLIIIRYANVRPL